MTPMVYASSDCPCCGSKDLLSVRLTVSETPLSFAFCTMCDWKGWEGEDASLPLGSVLQLANTR